MSFLRLHERSYKEVVDKLKIAKLIEGLSNGSIQLPRYLDKNKKEDADELIRQLVEKLKKYNTLDNVSQWFVISNHDE